MRFNGPLLSHIDLFQAGLSGEGEETYKAQIKEKEQELARAKVRSVHS